MLTRPRIEALARDPAAVTVEAIRDAVARADHEDAAARAVARLHAGEALAIDDVAEVLTGAPSIPVLLGLVGAVSGDRPAALQDLLDRHRFPGVAPGPDLAVAAVFALWRLGGRTYQPAIARHVRRLMLHELAPLASVLGTSVVDDLADPILTAATGDALCQPEPDWTLAAARALATPIGELVASLPAENEAARSVQGFTVRTGPRPGRNEPCPCGSGKKYKKCCADRDDAGAGSPIPGMSWDDFLHAGAGRMTPEQVHALPLRDLAQVEIVRLSPAAWKAAVRRLVGFRRWDLVARALDAGAEVTDAARDDVRMQAVSVAIGARALDWARAQLARIGDRTVVPPGDELRLAIHERSADALDRLDEASLAALRDDEAGDDVARIELAYALLDTLPALGVLVARDALRIDRRADSETLLEVIEDARDVLGLAPGDQAWRRWDRLVGQPAAPAAAPARDPDALEKEVRELRAALEVEAERVAELERQLERQRAAIAAATARPAGPGVESPEAAAERRALRERLESLQAQIREQNEERAELRRRLASGDRGARAAAPARRATPAVEAAPPDELESDAVAEAPRRAVVPRFARLAEDALDEVPAHVAAAAVRAVGELAAGDASAWRNVKQARDLEPPLHMARVGIHHRLLFRAEGAYLEVLDLVTRESLMHALKRQRR